MGYVSHGGVSNGVLGVGIASPSSGDASEASSLLGVWMPLIWTISGGDGNCPTHANRRLEWATLSPCLLFVDRGRGAHAYLYGIKIMVLTFILVFIGYGKAGFREQATVLLGSKGT